MIKSLFILFAFGLTGCGNVCLLSKANLDEKVTAEKVLKLQFSELPKSVQDTIQRTFEWYYQVNQTDSLKMPESYQDMVSLDPQLTFEDHVYKQSFERKAIYGIFYGEGEYFSISNQKFKTPITSYLILRIIYEGKLYLMGDPSQANMKMAVYPGKEAFLVGYKKYLYWVVELNKI